MGVPIAYARETTPTPINVTLVAANTEYSQVLPAFVHKFTMRARKNADDTYSDVCFAFATGQVPPAAGDYGIMQDGAPYGEDNLNAQLEIFLSSPTAGTIVEIIPWK